MTTLAPTDVDGVRVLRICGSLSQDGVDSIRKTFVDQLRHDGPNVVDVSDVTHINTPGLAMLLSAHRQIQASGGKLLLAGARGMVDEVIRCCHLDRVFVMAADAAGAVAQARSA
jgi:stage II sporulation protein AA (anti-sigma F factor antagonist)